jgi:hypothetical protein
MIVPLTPMSAMRDFAAGGHFSFSRISLNEWLHPSRRVPLERFSG